jgi:hypothetical protein
MSIGCIDCVRKEDSRIAMKASLSGQGVGKLCSRRVIPVNDRVPGETGGPRQITFQNLMHGLVSRDPIPLKVFFA